MTTRKVTAIEEKVLAAALAYSIKYKNWGTPEECDALAKALCEASRLLKQRRAKGETK